MSQGDVFHCPIPFFKDIYLGSVIIAKPRTDSGDNYMLSSPMWGKDPGKPLICLRNLKPSDLNSKEFPSFYILF